MAGVHPDGGGQELGGEQGGVQVGQALGQVDPPACKTRAGAGYLVSLGNQSEETQVFLANVVAIVITITILTDVTL